MTTLVKIGPAHDTVCRFYFSDRLTKEEAIQTVRSQITKDRLATNGMRNYVLSFLDAELVEVTHLRNPNHA